MTRATRKGRSRSNRKTRNNRARRGGAQTPWTPDQSKAYLAEQDAHRRNANARAAAYALLPKLPQSPNMTVEVGAFDLTVSKSSLKPGTPYQGMGQGRDPGWVGWNPAWSNRSAESAASSNNEEEKSVESVEPVASSSNNESTKEEEAAENAGVNSFLSGGSRRRRNSRKNRQTSRR